MQKDGLLLNSFSLPNKEKPLSPLRVFCYKIIHVIVVSFPPSSGCEDD